MPTPVAELVTDDPTKAVTPIGANNLFVVRGQPVSMTEDPIVFATWYKREEVRTKEKEKDSICLDLKP